jgi:uncharacterized protein YndB with AHSA1/START domain
MTRARRYVDAPRATVYRALIDADAIAKWKVPTGMTCHVHAFAAREGGTFRISLTYDAPSAAGKTSGQTDRYHGRFVELVPNERVVEVDEFETEDPALRGEMTVAITLTMPKAGPTCSRCTTGTSWSVDHRQRGRLAICACKARRVGRAGLGRNDASGRDTVEPTHRSRR